MKISDQDIVRMAQKLRDEENIRLHVRPWNRHRRFNIPAWLVAIPAAALIGFLLGIWTNSRQTTEHPLTALVDTVYIKVKDTVAIAPANHETSAKQPSLPHPSRARAKTVISAPRQVTSGLSMADDKIRYDLLVMN